MSDSSANPQQTNSEFPWSEFVEKQLAKIASLPPNWDRMDAEVPSQDAIADARNFLKELRLIGLDIPKPGIAPTRNGGILLVWEQGAKALEVEFEDSGTIGYLFEDEENRISREENLSPGDDTEDVQNYLNEIYG
jgi:hypothetical protein